MYKISKTFTFSASHVLDLLDPEHPCARLHGHNYTVCFFLQSETLDEYGFVKDYRSLRVVQQYLDDTFDHRHLNDILLCHPTAENLAHFLYQHFKPVFPALCAVEVAETPQTSCRYEP
jgi:6-pyruvoyltetrahydropterin/6-carboxytetrahydropterin synthase